MESILWGTLPWRLFPAVKKRKIRLCYISFLEYRQSFWLTMPLAMKLAGWRISRPFTVKAIACIAGKFCLRPTVFQKLGWWQRRWRRIWRWIYWRKGRILPLCSSISPLMKRMGEKAMRGILSGITMEKEYRNRSMVSIIFRKEAIRAEPFERRFWRSMTGLWTED